MTAFSKMVAQRDDAVYWRSTVGALAGRWGLSRGGNSTEKGGDSFMYRQQLPEALMFQLFSMQKALSGAFSG